MAHSWPPLLDPNGAGRRPITLEEWLELPEDDGGEVVHGVLEEEEVPDAVHELAVTWLVQVLRAWLGARGFVLGSEIKLVTGESSGRKPDLAVYFPESPPPPRRGGLRTPPDLLVEVVTPTPRDER